MSRFSLDGFNLHLPEDPETHRKQELQPCCILCSQPRRSLQLLTLNSILEDKIKYVPSVSFFSSKRQEGLVCPSRDTHPFFDGAPTLHGAHTLSLRISDLLTHKMQTVFKHQSAVEASCYLFPPLWFFLRLE